MVRHVVVQSVADQLRAGGNQWLYVAVGRRLESETETAVYRLVEDALRATDGPREALVACEPGGEVTVTVRPLGDAGAIGDLTTPAARLDLLGGSIETRSGELAARLPVGGQAGRLAPSLGAAAATRS